MKKVRLMADYGCDPLWKQPPYGVGTLSPESLPISEPLRKALHDWASEYDRTLDRIYPPDSGFDTQEAANNFTATGYILLEKLKEELGSEYEIDYFPNAYRRDIPLRGKP
jgi:hypothetical protein